MSGMEALEEEWKQVEAEISSLKESHRGYLDKLDELRRLQREETGRLKDFEKRLGGLRRGLKGLKTAEEAGRAADFLAEVAEARASLQEMSDELPKSNNGPYLNIILGTNIPLGLLRKEDKFRYKDEYEKFKLTVQVVAFVLAAVALGAGLRVVDALFHFLLVWYYCTLTIRESLLRLNGSRIKGWWVVHHYLSTVLCGVSLTWPDGPCYQGFRHQFLIFSLYLSVVQWLQCNYQRGVLYRLRSLGQGHAMDLTVDGFQSHMFKGLSFILPFLALAYLFQFYNAWCLARMYWGGCSDEWQIGILCILFLILALGNSATTAAVVAKKYSDKLKPALRRRLVTKYSTSSAPDPDAVKKTD